MKQVIVGMSHGQLQVWPAPQYCPLRLTKWSDLLLPTENAAIIDYGHPWSVAGTFKHLYFAINGALSVWPDLPLTLEINNVGTALTATIPAGSATTASAQNLVDTARAAPGDYVHWRRDALANQQLNGQCAPLLVSVTFESDQPGESGYGCADQFTTLNTANPFFCAPLSGGFYTWNPTALWDDSPQNYSIVSANGNLFRFDLKLSVAPGMGKSRLFVFLVNGVTQDGSGGTVDTRLTLSDLATSGVATFLLPLAVDDRLTLKQIPTGSPAVTNAMFSVGFRATTDGQSILAFDTNDANPANAGEVDYAGDQQGAWASTTTVAQPTPPGAPATELILALPTGIDPMTLSGYRVWLGSAPSPGQSYVFTTRKNLATPLAGPAVVIADTARSALDNTHAVSFGAPTDLLTVSVVSTPSAHVVTVGWTWLQVTAVAPPPPPPFGPPGCIITQPEPI